MERRTTQKRKKSYSYNAQYSKMKKILDRKADGFCCWGKMTHTPCWPDSNQHNLSFIFHFFLPGSWPNVSNPLDAVLFSISPEFPPLSQSNIYWQKKGVQDRKYHIRNSHFKKTYMAFLVSLFVCIKRRTNDRILSFFFFQGEIFIAKRIIKEAGSSPHLTYQ